MKTKLTLPILTILIALLGAAVANATTTNFTTSGSYTWTAPTGVTSISVAVWGGGGKGGTRTTQYTGGGGGGGAYSIKNSVSVTPGTGYTVVVGAGATTTAAGGDSYFINTSTVLAKGGGSVADNTTTGAAGGAAASGVGDTKYSGGQGGNANNTSGTTYGGGGGSSAGTAANGNYTSSQTIQAGATAPSGGGNGGSGFGTSGASGNGTAGSAPGGGGGGGKDYGSTGNGGNGADGQVSITYTLPATTVGTATATAASQTSILVTMPYTGDGNGNNTYTVEYKFHSGSTWTTWVANAAHTASPYTATITGLTPGGTYDVRVTYNDADGVTGSNPQTISSVTTTANGITTLQAWSNLYHNTATTVQNLTYAVSAGSGSQRVLVVAIASSQTATGNARTVTLTYGGQTMTPAVNGDMGTSTVRQHTALYYLNEAGLEAATTTTLSVTVSGGTTRITDVFAAVYDGVDQTTPITDSKTYSSGTSTATTFALSTGLAVGAGDQAVEIISSLRSANTTPRTVNSFATSWSLSAAEGWTTTDGVTNMVTTRSIPSSNVTADTTSTTMSGSSLVSMTAMSLGNAKATPALLVDNSPVTYNGSAQSATVVSSVGGTVSNVKYNGSATVPTSAGTYAVTADFAPTDATHYNSLTGASAGNFVINKATSANGLVSSLNPALPGSSVVFTATVSGVTTPSGTEIFKNGGAPFYTNTLASGSTTATNSALPHGNDAITAEYSGDVNFLTSTGSVSQVIDRPPVGGLQYLTTVMNTPLNVSATILAGLNYDADGDTLTITAVSSPSTQGFTVSLNGTGNTNITYTPTGSYVGADQFTYTISDGYGGTATCTNKVTVTLGKATSAFNFISGTTGTVNLRGYGVPGHSYDVQYSGDPTFSTNAVLTTVTAATGSGLILYTDTTAGDGPRYYRFAMH